ncbi:MAG: S4 domain-containing protein, partial [Clostridia bacterium]|nr:S4 domain-containing protein [Clostridia bacterium]
PFVVESLQKVVGAGIVCAQADAGGLVRHDTFREIRDTVASPRLDCVMAALLNLSRGDAAELIGSGLVAVNYEVCSKPAQPVAEGAAVSARGYGRFLIERLGPETKKGRLGFLAKKYL